jgi:rRNA maturation endonuclease Nob1
MATPNRNQVIERAQQLFMQEQARYPGLGETTPELSELKEAGFLDKAKMELMSSDFERPDPKMVEEVFNEMGINQNESLNAEKIEELKKQQKENTEKIMARLEAIPDLAKQIEALSKSKSFQPLGEALKPLSETYRTHHAKAEDPHKNDPLVLVDGKGFVYASTIQQPQQPQPEPFKQVEPAQQRPTKECFHCGRLMDLDAKVCPYCGAPVEPKKPRIVIPDWINPHEKIHPLDAFAGLMVAVIWLAASGWILSSYALSWGLIIFFAVFWLVFVVVFRLVIGGILD